MKTDNQKDSQAELPAVWVGDLGDYNAGILTGEWIVIEKGTTLEGLQDRINAILKRGVTEDSPHEEWFVADYNYLPLSAQYPDLSAVIVVAQLVIEQGYRVTKAFIDHFGEQNTDEFYERFCGVYDSVQDYVHELINDCYNLETVMGELSSYFDYEKYANDLEYGGDITSSYIGSGQVAIFHNY